MCALRQNSRDVLKKSILIQFKAIHGKYKMTFAYLAIRESDVFFAFMGISLPSLKLLI